MRPGGDQDLTRTGPLGAPWTGPSTPFCRRRPAASEDPSLLSPGPYERCIRHLPQGLNPLTPPHPPRHATHRPQLDLDTQLQRCLNYEAYEAAQEVRKKRQRVSARRGRWPAGWQAGAGGEVWVRGRVFACFRRHPPRTRPRVPTCEAASPQHTHTHMCIRVFTRQVDEAVQSMKERKARNTGAPVAVQRLAGADYAAELLRLRTEMQRAVEAEE